MNTDTLILASAMDILSRDIQSNDGGANAAIAEAADRLRTLHRHLENVKTALRDAISTYDSDRKVVLISAERQEAWNAALQNTE